MLDALPAGAQATARQRANARLQLLQREGLGHVVVGPEVQALHALLDRVGRRQDEHRQVGVGAAVAGAQPAQDLQAAQLRQARSRISRSKVWVDSAVSTSLPLTRWSTV
jgi:hypothetical protein